MRRKIDKGMMSSELTKEDLEKLERNAHIFLEKQNLLLGILGGLLGALVGAIIWGVLSSVMKYQMGLIAVFLGFLVGLGVRFLGKGIGKEYMVIGGVFSVLGCALGNLITQTLLKWGWEFLENLNSADLLALFIEKFQPYDLIFYALAVFIGVKFSVRVITREELAKLP